MKISGLGIIAAVICTACGDPVTEPEGGLPPARRDTAPVSIATAASGPAVQHGSLVTTAFWIDPADTGQSLVLGAAGIAGVDLHALDGQRVGNVAGIDAGHVTVLPDVEMGGEIAPLVVVYDLSRSAIDAYRLDRESLEMQSVMPQALSIADELTGLCHYRSALSGSDYLYAVTDRGFILHYQLDAGADGVAARLLRSIPSGKGSGFCAVDARDATLYISEEESGIWALGAEPESDTTRRPLDLRAPFGSLSDDLKGLAIYPVNAEQSYLVISDVGESRFAVYELPDGQALGTVTVDGVGEAESVAITPLTLGDTWPNGVLAIANEFQNEFEGGTNLQLVGWRAFADALSLRAAEAGVAPPAQHAVVRPVLETDTVASFGDAADDPAIWRHPDDPTLSLVIGTDKKAGLYVYDLDGRTLQVLPDGRMNNADVRYDFTLAGETVDIIAASNRSNDSIAVYRIDAEARKLVDIADGVLATGFTDPYGSCMYRSALSGEFYVFINEGDSGVFRQWRLFDNGNGRVAAEQVREFPVGSQTEGCVADDELGHLYVGEEDVALWKYSAEPDGGTERTQIDSTGDDGNLTDDVEGVALWAAEDGSGYIVASNQGADNYAVYRREGNNGFVGHFHVVANPEEGIDGASETDGLDVVSAALGDRFPAGLLVVQDGRNIAPEDRQNFKFVSWADVMEALDLVGAAPGRE
jgi:3-phytase